MAFCAVFISQKKVENVENTVASLFREMEAIFAALFFSGRATDRRGLGVDPLLFRALSVLIGRWFCSVTIYNDLPRILTP